MAISNNVKVRITSMLVEDIGSKEVVDGITYVLLTNTGKDAEKIRDFYDLQKRIGEENGGNVNSILRSYKVANGVIFDLDIGVAKQTSSFLIQSAVKSGSLKGANLDSFDQIKDKPEKRRREDIEKLGAFLRKCYKEKKYVVDVALFSRNKVGTTAFNAKKDGKDVMVQYKAYAIRHWDIDVLNNVVLANDEFKVVKVDAGEIVPTKNGVRFRLTLGK